MPTLFAAPLDGCRRSFVLAGLALVAFAAPLAAAPLAPIEAIYDAPGPYATAETTVDDDAGRRLYEVFTPAPLLNTAMPVVVWGNGTGALPKDYAPLLAHLASWGFVVIDTFKQNTGDGRAILQAAVYAATQNATPKSPLFRRLDPARIGAAGHSQGAAGVINAATRYPDSSLIATVVSIAVPRLDFSDASTTYDTSQLVAPLFLISGTEDLLISPASTNNAAYRRTDDALPAAKALKKGAGHSEITPDGGSERGYLTAWLQFRLQGDAVAAEAFSGPDAELLTNGRWKSAATQNLP